MNTFRHFFITALALLTALPVLAESPTITSNGGGGTANINVAENTTAVTTVVATDADTPAQTITYTKSGTNAALFNIDSGTGALTFAAAPDFETTVGTFAVTVTATDDGAGASSDSQDLTITVTNVNEMPSFTKGANQTKPFGTATTQTVAGWAAAIDDGDSTVTQALTFNITGNTNAGMFTTLPAISSTGTLTYTPNGTAGTATISVTLTDDASINANATLTTAAQTFTISVSAQPATALNFDGVDDRVVSSSTVTLFGSTPTTIELWANRLTGNGGRSPIGIGNNVFYLNVSGGTFQPWMEGANSYNSGATVTGDVWTHWAVTYDGAGTWRAYKNGQPTPTPTFSFNYGAQTGFVYVGSRGTGGGDHFKGEVDEVRVWNVERSAAEILANYNTQLSGSPAGLLVYYRFNQGLVGADNSAVTIANDATGSRNGTLMNMALTGASSNWAAGVLGGAEPGITVGQPAGTNLVDNTSRITFGTVSVGNSSAPKTFTITNNGTADLSGLAVSKDGANTGDFVVDVTGMATMLVPGGSTTFLVTYTPTATGQRGAALHIASNAFGSSNPFDIILLDNPNSAPTNISLSASSLAENNAPNATVGTLAATDADGGTHTFTLVSGTGSTDNASFTIAGNALKLTPSADFETKSSYAVRVLADDGFGGTFSNSFTVTITNVNEMPSFTKGADRTHPIGTATAQSVADWATAIDDGDSTVTQTLTFNITGNTTPGIFTTPPGIASDGTLTYTPNSTAGTATISVTLTDDATINSTAALTTAVQTFSITVQGPPDYTVTTAGNVIVITDVSGNSDTLALSEPSAGNIMFAAAGRTFSVDGGAAITGDSGTLSRSGVTQITVNAGAGADILDVSAFTGTLPSLALNGGTGNDTVNLNADILFASGNSLVVNAETLNTSAGADVTTSGVGVITITADGVALGATSTLVSSDTITLKQQTANRPVNLGTETAGSLSLTDTELDRITAGRVQIGDSNSGTITLCAVISPLAYNTLALGNTTLFASTGGFISDIGNTAAIYEKITVTGFMKIDPAATLTMAATGGFVPAVFQTFTLISNDSTDSIGGTFSGLAQGATIPGFLGSALNAKISYNAGTGNDVVVNTSLAALTVVAANQTRAYGAANPVFTGTITGIQAPDVITAFYGTSASAGSPVGTYPIVAKLSGANLGNYVVTNTPGVLSITPALTSVAAANMKVIVTAGAQSVALTAAVTSPTAVVNQGTVTFQLKDGVTNVGSAVVSSTVVSGTAGVTYIVPAATPVGVYTIQTTYSGGTDFGASTNNTSTCTVIVQSVLGSLVVSGFANPATAGTAYSFTVTARNGSGTIITSGYAGTVSFSSSDADASLPASYTFTPADAGVHTFSGTLRRAGTHSLTAMDATAATKGSQTGIVVNARSGTAGQLYAWGLNFYGQLGDNSTTPRNTRVPVSGITDAISIAGRDHSLAVKPDGTVWAWGKNDKGQLGDNTTTQRLVPVPVTDLTGVTSVAAGGLHSLALKSDGTVWAWGSNGYGQLGDPTTKQRLVPVQVTGVDGVTSVAAGVFHSLALKSDGTVWAWGFNNYGQLGDNTTTVRPVPVQVTGLTGVRSVAAGIFHSLALKSDGTVWAWGDNYFGQLGDNTTTQRQTPVRVKGVGGVGTLTSITAISAGNVNGLALKSDGTVWAWGDNYNGQLGDNTFTPRLTPVQVKGVGGVETLTGVSSIASGVSGSLARKTDGTVWAWGFGGLGQMGNGTSNPFNLTPVQTTGFTSASLIASGGQHNLAVDGGSSATQFLVKAPASTNAGTPFNVTITAVDGSNKSVAYTGTVRFTSSDLIAGLPANYTFLAGDQGSKTFSVTLNSSGTRTVVATDTVKKTLTGTAPVSVNSLATTTTTQTIATSFDSLDQAVTLTAQVTTAGGTVHQGLVTFQIKTGGGTNVGTAVISGVVVKGVATVTYIVPGGTSAAIYPIHASYSGGESFAASIGSSGNLRLGQAPTNMATDIASATAPYSLAAQTVGLSASVTSTAGTVNEGTITFRVLDGSSNVIESALKSATLVSGSEGVTYLLSPGLPAGGYTIEASYSGGVNFESSTGTATLTVTKTNSTLLATSATTNFSNPAQNINFGATATSPVGTLNEGTVTFQLKTGGGVNVGSAVTSGTIVSGSTIVTYALPAAQSAGIYTLFATYSGSGSVNPGSDNTKTLEVIIIPVATTTLAANASVNENASAQNVTLSATVTGQADPVNEGTVTFQLVSNGVNIGSAVTSGTVTGGAASVTYVLPAAAPGGDYIIEATYNGTVSFLASSGIGTLSVSAAPSDITLTPSGIAENNAANDTVGTLAATDANGVDTHTFTFVTGAGDTDNASFTIVGNLLKLTPGTDFETKSSYEVRLRATNAGALAFEKALIVTISNVNEMPSFTKGGDKLHLAGTSTAQSFSAWATGIADGDSSVTQSLTFNINITSGAGIFTTPPGIDSSTGTLTYTPNGTVGTATVDVWLTDDNSINGNAALSTVPQTPTITVDPAPEIAITQTSAVVDGGSIAFGTVTLGSSSALTFTITNPGTADLTGLAFAPKDGTNPGDFTVSALSGTGIVVGSGTVTFTVTFTPGASGARSAGIHITSNVTGAKNPFDIALTGTGQTVFTAGFNAWATTNGVSNDPDTLGANGL